MKFVTVLEEKLAAVFAAAPALPPKWRAWIAGNLSWLIFALSILSAVGLAFALISLLLVAYVGRFSLLATSESVSLILAAIVTGLMFKAVTPLKERAHRGWQLLFITELISVVSALVSLLIQITDPPVGNLLLSLVITAAELYVLYQVRDRFTVPEARAAKAKANAAGKQKPAR